MPKVFCRLVCLAVACCLIHAARAQTPPVAKTDAQLDEEAKQAEALYQSSQLLSALPLYEDLHAQRPGNALYTEFLAMAWVAKGGAAGSPEEARADNQHALNLFKEIQAAGKKSDLTQIMIEKLTAGLAAQPQPAGTLPQWRQVFDQAEILFNKGDLKGSVDLYRKSWEENPQFYSAPLFAGDAEYKLGHYDEAGVWFARAIAVNPDAETAHRYWADCLAKAGKPEEARRQYIEAFIADPYQKAPRLELISWARKNQMPYVAPTITLPAAPTTSKDGKINIIMAPPQPGDKLAPAWLAYSMQGALWQGDKFKKAFPNEKQYRHTLMEEVDSLKLLLTVIGELKIAESDYTPTIRSLMALDKDGMLECWVLLDNPDNGTAQDYVAFRATHRDLLRAYIMKYDLHPA